MNSVRKVSIKTRLVTLAVACLTAVAFSVSVGFWSTERLGELSQRVFVSKDVVADILPPPLYLIEMRLVISRLFEKTLEPAAAQKEVERLAKEYQDRVTYWQANPPYGLERHLLGVQHEQGQKFITTTLAVTSKAKAEGVDGLRDELPKLQTLYEAHRSGVDETVSQANKFAATEAGGFATVAAATRTTLLATLVLVVGLLTFMFLIVFRSIISPLNQSLQSIRRVAEGDLSVDVVDVGRDELTLLSTGLRDMQMALADVVASVRQGSDAVAGASTEIAHGNQDLSGRTELQATALQETAASMHDLDATVKRNADSARLANQLAITASTVALHGGEVVGHVVKTMRDINESSSRISDIIGVIDGIAFQTNILALNAAVEAARAGEQGRGFAVVASEVRSLAGRSADAAKEIKSLINASVERVEHGNKLVSNAGETMTEVVTAIKKVADILGEISSANSEQSNGMSQVGDAVSQMEQTTQQNAAMVEQMAASANSLMSQAQDLVQSVALFKLPGEPVQLQGRAPVTRSIALSPGH